MKRYVVALVVFVILCIPAVNNDKVFIFKDQCKVTHYPFSVNCKEDMEWLVQNIYHESRGEGYDGMLVVAIITLNRVKNERWPNSVKDVVTDPYQFSWYNKFLGYDNPKIVLRKDDRYKRCVMIAETAIEMYREIQNDKWKGMSSATHYHTKNVKPGWANKLTKVGVIGNHILYNG